MQIKTIIPFFLFVLLQDGISLAQTFPCSGDFIISIYQIGEAPTKSFEIDYDGTAVSFSEVVSSDVVFNAAGFNRLDNFIYAAEIYSNNIIRIKSDGTFDVVGSDPSIDEWESAAGDVNKNGVYVLQNKNAFKLHFYEVTQGFNKINEVVLQWHPNSGNIGVCELPLDDIVFDPNNPNVLYSYQRAWPSQGFPNQPEASRGYLLKINVDFQSPEFGLVETVAPVDNSIVIHLGGLFFDAKKELYAYGSVVPGPILQQKKLIRINKNTGATSLIGIGPISTGVDGCSCPYTLSLEKFVKEAVVTCADEYIHFDFELSNNAEVSFDNLIFSDTFPEGMEIVEILPENPLDASPSAGTGIGTNILHYANAFQAADSKTNFSVKVKNPGGNTVFCNQAFLQVPDDFGGTVLSDDPGTNVFSDSSCVQIKDFDLNDALITIKDPVNCLSQDDGEIIIESSHFHEGNSYLVSYLLDGIEQGPFEIMAEDGFLIISGLIPGLYTELQVTSQIEASCFSEIEGEFGLFVPLGLPAVEVKDLDDGCESDTNHVVLNVFNGIDGANYTWTGPNDFMSLSANADLGIPKQVQSGTYHLEVEKDSCYAYDSIEVIIHPLPQIDIQIENEIDPCQLPVLHLQSSTVIESITWSPAENLSCNSCPDPQVVNINASSFSVLVNDLNGCSSELDYEWENQIETKVYLPNSFSPNKDGINDYFTVYANCTVEKVLNFKIFDRWGNLLFANAEFQANDELAGWNGTLDEEQLDTGIFVYLVELLYIDGSRETLKGDVSLIR